MAELPTENTDEQTIEQLPRQEPQQFFLEARKSALGWCRPFSPRPDVHFAPPDLLDPQQRRRFEAATGQEPPEITPAPTGPSTATSPLYQGRTWHREDFEENVEQFGQLLGDAEMVRKIFKEAFRRADLSLWDLTPQRLRVAYRIVRHLASVLGVIGDFELLEEAMDLDESWYRPNHYPVTVNPARRGTKALQNLLRKTDCPLLPKHDAEPQQLERYVRIIEQICMDLNIYAGGRNDPEYGRDGMAGLIDPRTVAYAMPLPMELMTFEAIMVEETMTLIPLAGSAGASRELYEMHGYRMDEAITMIRMARQLAQKLTEADVETERAVMILRLEDFINRSRQAFDLRAEMQGYKQLSLVQGLSRTEGGNAVSDFVNVVQRLAQAGKPKPLPPAHILLPPPPSIPVAAKVVG